MSARLTLVVVLHVDAGRENAFERFEMAAAAIMRRHGGVIERRIAVEPGAGASHPREVHIVTFPDRTAYDRYRADPALQPLAALRADAIRETVVWFGTDRAPFAPQPA